MLYRTIGLALLCSALALLVRAQVTTDFQCTPLATSASGATGNYVMCFLFAADRKTVALTVEADPIVLGGWVAFGLIEPGDSIPRMNGAKVAIGWTDGTPANTYIGGYETVGFDITPSNALGLITPTIALVDSGPRVKMSFTIPVDPTLILTSGDAKFNFAHGAKGTGQDPNSIIGARHQQGSNGNSISFNFLTSVRPIAGRA